MLSMPATTSPPHPSAGRFAALGADVVVGGATDAELTAVRRLFERRARALGADEPDSELRWVNRSDAPLLAVSALFADTLGDALLAARETGGLADPTGAGRWPEVRLVGRLLRRPPGVTLDLGSVLRGRTVDDAVRLISGPGYVAAGHDLATRSGAVVALPRGGTLHMRRGGLATVTAPAGEPWQTVTVAAPTCRDAGIAARAALGLGAAGPAWLDAHDLPGRFTGVAGAVANRRWRATAAAPAIPSDTPPARRPDPIDLPGERRS